MQRRVEIPVVGVWPALRHVVLPLVHEHRAEAGALLKAAGPQTRTCETYRPKRSTRIEPVPSGEVIDDLLAMLARLAVAPQGNLVRSTTPPSLLFDRFAVAPNLTLAVLTKARKAWFKSGKAAGLWRWLASNEGVQPLAHQAKRTVWECTDGELALGYETATAEPVEPCDAEKARKKLAADIRKGEKLLRQLVETFR